jgi:hypothetical protein
MKLQVFFLLFILLIVGLTSCHNLRYISKNYDTLVKLDTLCYDSTFNNIELKSIDSNGYTIIKTLSKDSTLISIESFDNETDRRSIGESKYYYPNGNLKRLIYYKKKNFYSKVKTFYSNGALKRDDSFNDTKFISGTCYDSLGNKIAHTDFEIDPTLDIKLLQNCLKYPEKLRRLNYEEKVILRLFVNKSGKIIAVKFDSNNSSEFVNRAIKCIKKLNEKYDNFVKPMYLDNEPDDSWVSIPIVFILK